MNNEFNSNPQNENEQPENTTSTPEQSADVSTSAESSEPVEISENGASTGRTEDAEVEIGSGGEPPEDPQAPEKEPEVSFAPKNSQRKNAVNVQYRPQKTSSWIVALLCVIGGLYIVLSSVAIIAFLNFAKVKDQLPSFEQLAPEAEHPEEKIEEHLKINESPVSEGAKTTDGALTVKQISEKVRESVVGVTCQSSSGFSAASVGSGIIMTTDGYIITNNHVIEGMTVIQVVLDNGKTYDAHLIGSDSRSDLAVIKINAEGLKAAEFGDSDKLEQGDPAIAIGNPAGLQLQNTVTSGIISAINRDIVVEDRTMTLIQTDASINPGNSGGPLVNEFGQVIGINTIKVGISYYEGLGFAIPMNTAKPIIDELISRGYVKGRPSIGINGTTLSKRDSAFYGLPAGLYIEYVHPHSDAFKKGIRRGDIITKMNGTALSSTAEIKKIRDNFTAGDTITLTIYRNAQEVDVEVILMDEATLSNSTAEES